MTLQDVVGETYGPYSVTMSAAKVAEYVSATGDRAERWQQHAPPSYAGALLFVVAPYFLNDARVRPFTGVLVHADQSFTWHAPLTVGTEVTVAGKVEKVRERSGAFFVTFSASVDSSSGDRVLDAVATFLMGEGLPPAADSDTAEPAVAVRGSNDLPTAGFRPVVGETFTLAKSASRLDLVKYAGASGDFNPIHFDHDAARGAGLAGIVVHGLLMTAWGLQAVATLSTRPDPIAHAKIRFRNALRPGEQATAIARVADMSPDDGDCQVPMVITRDETKLVTALCVARLDG